MIYVAVAITAVSVVPWQELAAAPAPLAMVMERAAPARVLSHWSICLAFFQPARWDSI